MVSGGENKVGLVVDPAGTPRVSGRGAPSMIRKIVQKRGGKGLKKKDKKWECFTTFAQNFVQD